MTAPKTIKQWRDELMFQYCKKMDCDQDKHHYTLHFTNGFDAAEKLHRDAVEELILCLKQAIVEFNMAEVGHNILSIRISKVICENGLEKYKEKIGE